MVGDKYIWLNMLPKKNVVYIGTNTNVEDNVDHSY